MKTLVTKFKRRSLETLIMWLIAALVAGATAWGIRALFKNWAHDDADARRQSAQRDAAVAERAKLSAGMMGVLFSDAQAALAATLNSAPREGTSAFLERWREVNPLVAAALPVNARGVPDDETPLSPAFKDWLAKTPWFPGAVAEKSLPPADSLAANAAPDDTAWGPLREKSRAAAARDPWHLRGTADGGATPISAGSVGSLPPGNDYAHAEGWAERRRRLGIPFAERSGWDAVPGGLFLWRMCDDDLVLAASVDLRELEKLLASALPSNTQDDESHTLLTSADAANPKVAGASGSPAFVRDFPVQSELLPGWTVRVIRVAPDNTMMFRQKMLYRSYYVLVFLMGVMIFSLLAVVRNWMDENERFADAANHSSHEMITAVQMILCCTDKDALTVLDADGRERQAPLSVEDVTLVNHAARRISEMVFYVLDFSQRIMRGEKIRRGVADTNLVQVVTILLDDLRVILGDCKIGMTIESSLPPGPVCVKTDDSAVSLILRNLLDHARIHGGKDRRVAVALVENTTTGMVDIKVRDYTCAVTPAELPRVFKRRSGSKEKERGHSIDLPTSRELARALDGDLSCEIPSDGEGGAIFILSLPK